MKINSKTIFGLLFCMLFSLNNVVAQNYSRPRAVTKPHGTYQYQPQTNNQQRNDNYYPQQSSSYESGIYYKGFLETGFTAGVGNDRANELDILTTHGISISDMFFMGIGTGVNILFPQNGNHSSFNDNISYNSRDGIAMIPLYLDFRISSSGSLGAFFDCKFGVSFFTGEDFFVNDSYFYNNQACYYFSPTVGIRFATSRHGAVNLGLTYNLIGHGNFDVDYYGNYHYYDGPSLSGLGARIALEW